MHIKYSYKIRNCKKVYSSTKSSYNISNSCLHFTFSLAIKWNVKGPDERLTLKFRISVYIEIIRIYCNL